MTFLIDNKPAVIKKDTVIDYVSSNLLFDDREDFSLAFEVPLRGCKINREIFSEIYRKDVDIDTLYYDAEIFAGNFHVSGAVTIVEVTDDHLKLQFISGRSFKNFYVDWDEKFINELELGSYDTSIGTRTPASMWGSSDVIALPWVNNSSGNLQNRAEKVNGTWTWHTQQDDDDDTEVVKALSCQLRLYVLVQKICAALGYTLYASEWASHPELYNLYMLNTVPAVLKESGWAQALPHWSLNDFFAYLEKLLLGEFDIDHKRKTVTFSFSIANQAAAGEVEIADIVDEFSVDVTNEDKSDYAGTANTGYQTCSHPLWNFYSCFWYFKKHPHAHVQQYATLQQLINHIHTYGPSKGRSATGSTNDQWLLYAQDMQTYFVLVERLRKPTDERTSLPLYGSGYELRPVNRFGDWIVDIDDYKRKDDIRFVPAWLDLCVEVGDDDEEIVKGRVLFLEPGTTDNESASGIGHRPPPSSMAEVVEWQKEVSQTSLFTTQVLMNGDSDSDHTYYDKIYVGFWYGEPGVFGDKLPAPWIDQFEIESDWDYVSLGNSQHKIVNNYTVVSSGHDGTLRINNLLYRFGPTRDAMTKIDEHKRYEFSFISDDVPNVRSKFYIRGKWYLCSELQAEITHNGLKPVMKGTFWRITG